MNQWLCMLHVLNFVGESVENKSGKLMSSEVGVGRDVYYWILAK